MRNFYFLYLVGMLLLGCKSKPEETSANPKSLSSSEQYGISSDNYVIEKETSGAYEDGEYCATIRYHNSSTGNSSTYTLEVEIENGELVQINWPNGGWLDSSHFSPPEIDAEGSCSFSTYDGKDYEVQIEGTGGCNTSYSSPEDDDEEVEEKSVEELEVTEEEQEEIVLN